MITAHGNGLNKKLNKLSVDWECLSDRERIAQLEELAGMLEGGSYHQAQRAACVFPAITETEANTEIAFFVKAIKVSILEVYRKSFQAEHEFQSWDETWQTLFAIQYPEARA